MTALVVNILFKGFGAVDGSVIWFESSLEMAIDKTRRTGSGAAADCWLPRQPCTDWSSGSLGKKRVKDRQGGKKKRKRNGE